MAHKYGSDESGAEPKRPAFLKWLVSVVPPLFMGVICLLVAFQDHDAHTGRAEAVVSRVSEHGDGSDADWRVYVDYRAEGRDFTEILGEVGDLPATGDTLTVAYDPADPGDPVRAEAVGQGPEKILAGFGIVLLALSGLFAYREVAPYIRARAAGSR